MYPNYEVVLWYCGAQKYEVFHIPDSVFCFETKTTTGPVDQIASEGFSFQSYNCISVADFSQKIVPVVGSTARCGSGGLFQQLPLGGNFTPEVKVMQWWVLSRKPGGVVCKK